MATATEGPAGVPAGPSGRRRHLVESIVSVLAGSGIYALSIVTGPLLSRSLNAAGRGELAAVLVPSQLLQWILALGLPLGSAYYSHRFSSRDLMAGAWALAVGAGVPVGALIWFLAPHYLAGHAPATIFWLRVALVLGLLVTPAMTALELLRATKGAGVLFNVLRSVGPVANFLVLVLLALTDRLTLGPALAAAILSNVGAAALTLAVLHAAPARRLNRQATGLVLRYSLRASVGDASGLVVSRLDQVILVAAVATKELGIYAVAATAASVSVPVAQGLSAALFPHLLAGSATERAQRIRTGLWLTLASSLAATVLLAVTAPWLLPLAFGAQFSAAVVPLWLLLPGQVCANLGMVQVSVLQARNQPGLASLSSIVGALVTVVGIVPAIRLGGIEGAAVLTSLSQGAQLLALVLAPRFRGGGTTAAEGAADVADGELHLHAPGGAPAPLDG